MQTLTLTQARRIALAAQGMGGLRPVPVTMRQVQRTIDRVAQFQIDTINVVERAHYLPLYSRFGPYDTAVLERAAGRAPRRLIEYWGHAASLVDVRLEPALRFRMARAHREAWGRMRQVAQDHPELVQAVRDRIAAAPATAAEVEMALADAYGTRGDPRGDDWGWNWSQVKVASEWLFWSGEIGVARRTPGFQRVFDLSERILPPAVSATPTPTDAQAHLQLVRRAAEALGVATQRCLADYFRLDPRETAAAVSSLELAGELVPVRVPGWTDRAWLWHAARRPRRIDARALVSPFDSLVFERRRLRGLFGFDYGIEIYVPAPKRRFGYYVYPFLLGEQFVARVDLKADRKAGELIVRSAWLEEGTDPDVVRGPLRAELDLLAGWLDLRVVRALPVHAWDVPGNGRPMRL